MWTSLLFQIFSETRQQIMRKNKLYLEASICDVSMVE